MSDVSQIDGSVVRLRREAQGWAINDLAARACLSVKQIRQIEEGGLSAFYSETVKLTAAKKVASLLELSEAQLFGLVPLYPSQAEEESHLFDAQSESFRMDSADAALPASVESTGVHLSRSEPLHFLAQPPEVQWAAQSQDEETSKSKDVEDVPPASALPVSTSNDALVETPSPSGNYFLKILVLFLVAIAVAALLRPHGLETSTAAPEASTGQSMTPAVTTPPAEGALPTDAAMDTHGGAVNGSAEVKPVAPAAAAAGPSTGTER
jgi:transcriptional regulator with XRE-family HTH domain